ncbi:hypothetical protein evm_007649 [Chilo suppressalis]|nr:hypothetical protein evm_007649 [Chilo suppressalis]
MSLRYELTNELLRDHGACNSAEISETHKKQVNNLSQICKRELEQNEEKERIKKIEKDNEIAKNEQLLRESLRVEKEADSIERECIILKKRNNAIMLKLRRKLVETENLRKELMRKRNSEK